MRIRYGGTAAALSLVVGAIALVYTPIAADSRERGAATKDTGRTSRSGNEAMREETKPGAIRLT